MSVPSPTLILQGVLFLVVLAHLPGRIAAQDRPPAKWDGPLCKPVDREAAHEFTREPTVKKVGADRYDISFACKGNGDVAVAVEDASGRIVRHLVYGVLGSNAPAPLKPGTLEQTITWDGTDEFGKYVKHPEQCRVRVSLGLRPTFDKIIGWHPKDMTEWRRIQSIVASDDGVYVLECPPFGHPTLRRYDHDANYVRTIYPWDPDKLDSVQIPKRTLPDGKIWRDKVPPAKEQQVPVLTHYGATAPFGEVEHSATSMAIAAGKIGIYTDGKAHPRRLLRLRTDGTTGGEPLEGGLFTPRNTAVPSYFGQAHMVLSPDGKWVYVTGLGRAGGFGNKRDRRHEKPPFTWNAVFRFDWNDTGVVVEGRDSFVGELSRDAKTCGAGSDNEHLNAPQGLACDSAGRLYIADHNNHRIQVFSPEAKYLRTISVREPQEITVHPKTGEIYVLCFRRHPSHGVENRETITLLKFAALDLNAKQGPAELMRQTFTARIPGDPREFGYPVPVMALDAWATETRIWLVHESGVIRVYAERDRKWVLFDDFEADVRRAGHTPFSMHGKKMGYINVDPVRGHVYRISTRTMRKRRIDPEEGKTWQVLDVGKLPHANVDGGGVEEATFGWNGLMYLRTLKYLARFNPEKFPATGTITLNASNELPFDYGEEAHATTRKGEESAVLRGVVRFPWAQGGPNGYNNGLGISPRGDILILTENYQDVAGELANAKKTGTTQETSPDNLFRRLLQDQGEHAYRPALYPGRLSNANIVCRWNSKGELLGQDALPGLTLNAFGIRSDPAGNIIVGVGSHANVDGQAHIGGTLAKFPPQGGRLIGDSASVAKLDQLPTRPPDFLGGGVGRAWAQNLFWSAPGLDQICFVDPVGNGYPCGCYHAKFDTDPYGRTFMPRAYAYHVQVLDANGNRICRIGRFGNADKPAMKPGDTDIGLGQCSFLATVSDKWLYIADDSNMRIIRVKLDYQTQKRIGIGGQ